MKKLIIALMLALAGSLGAATETHTFVVPDTFTDFAATATVPLFDPANGTLVSATLSVQATNITSTRVENLDRVAGTATCGSTVTVTAGALASAVASKSFTNNLARFDGIVDYAGTSGASNAPATSSASSTVVLDNASVTGTGSYDIPVTAAATSFFTGFSAYSFNVATKAAIKITVTYTFTPNCPEPSPDPTPKPGCKDKDKDKDKDRDDKRDGKDRDCKPGKWRKP